jgi:hypothetical protein
MMEKCIEEAQKLCLVLPQVKHLASPISPDLVSTQVKAVSVRGNHLLTNTSVSAELKAEWIATSRKLNFLYLATVDAFAVHKYFLPENDILGG